MLNFRFISIIIFLVLASSSSGQAPGYLGKRLFVEGNIGMNIGLGIQGISNDLSDENGVKNYQLLRPNAKASVNWVYNRHRYIALEVGYQQFSTNQEPLYLFAGQPALKYRISNPSIGIGFFRTSKRRIHSLAPIGFHFGYKIIVSRVSANPFKYVDSDDKFDGVERAAYNLKYSRAELNFLGLAISSGFRTVLKDKITLKYAFDFGYRYPMNESLSRDRPFAFTNEDLKRNSSFYLNFHIGCGVLLF